MKTMPIKPMDIDCGRCGAKPGEQCTALSGNGLTKHPHGFRAYTAREANQRIREEAHDERMKAREAQVDRLVRERRPDQGQDTMDTAEEMGLNMKIKGQVYEASVAQVVEKDPDGRPRVLRLVYPQEKVSTADEPEFMVGFFPAHCLKPSPKRHN